MNDSSELATPLDKAKRDWPLLLSLATIGITLVGLLPAYFIFWHRSDVVFDKRAVEIPLSEPLRRAIEDALASSGRISDSVTVSKNGTKVNALSRLSTPKVPDSLLYVNIRNVGKIPSASVRVQIVVPGLIADRDVSGAGPVLGDVTQLRDSDDGIYFECPNLANRNDARFKLAVWYQKTKSDAPSVQVLETAEGPAREVGSVDTAAFYLMDLPSHHLWVLWLVVSVPVLALQVRSIVRDIREIRASR